ncbi:MAG: DUF92 domain-containing protein [Acidobacteria bacterium]|nr:MAG: DUF92 domain-containing protein [Acidobacteriota bacterium]
MSRGELARKLIHLGAGTIAFAVVFLGPAPSALVALLGLATNLLVLPAVGGKRLWREDELARGVSAGIVFYPLSVLILILAFRRHPEVAAATWGLLAFGDGMAGLVGMRFGRRPLPWNPAKTWLGSLAYAACGGLASAVLLWWTVSHPLGAGGRPIDLGFVAAICAVTAIAAAFLESLPLGLDDNLGVPLVAGLLLFALRLTEGRWALLDWPALASGAAAGLAFNLVLAAAALGSRALSASGAVAGVVVGTAIYAGAGWRGYLLLVAFVVLGSAATRAGYARKRAAGLSQEHGGRRRARHALANGAVAALAATFAVVTPYRESCLLALAGALATALGDTLSSELGQLWGRRPVLLTTFRRAPPGTDGAISAAGTLAGLAGALAIAALGAAAGLYPAAGAALVVVAGFAGTTADSLLGATLERRGLLDNEAVNFLATLAGALTAGVLAAQ